VLATPDVHEILRTEWFGLLSRHGWAVGPYVVMPNHVHFFVAQETGESKKLSLAIEKWKEWTAKRIVPGTSMTTPVWQPEFFDHVLRSGESRSEKWNYMRNNPVRAGLAADPSEWPFAGSVHFESTQF
jgi:REP element-mobilizing transposase RayT